jgi:hypothetical protein
MLSIKRRFASSNGPKGASTIPHFTSGSGVEWMRVRPRIIQQFEISNCWEFVNPEAGATEDENHNPVINEVKFDEVEPRKEDFVDARIAEYDASVEAMYQANLEEIGLAEVSAAIKASKRLDASTNRNQSRLLRADKLSTYERLFDDKWKTWDIKKKDHASNSSKVIEVFTNCLGTGPLAVCRANLQAKKYKQAWKQVDDLYSGDAKTGNSKKSIYDEIGSAVYEEKSGLMQHLDYLEELFAQANLDEDHKLAVLINSLKNSKCRDFNPVINYFSYSLVKGTYTELVNLLHQKETELREKKNLKESAMVLVTREKSKGSNQSFKKRKHETSGSEDEDSEAPAIVRCSTCNKQYHTSEQCWQNVPCPKCGIKGHGARDCKANKEEINQGSGNKKKYRGFKPKLTANFEKKYPKGNSQSKSGEHVEHNK